MPRARNAPKECDEFHIDIFVASSFGCIQCASIFAQGGNPMPCVQPFNIQNAAKRNVSDEQPKRKFMRAESARPAAMKTRPFRRSAQNPFTKRLIP